MLWICIWSPYATVVIIGPFGNRNLITPLFSQCPSCAAKLASIFNPIMFALSHPKYDNTSYLLKSWTPLLIFSLIFAGIVKPWVRNFPVLLSLINCRHQNHNKNSFLLLQHLQLSSSKGVEFIQAITPPLLFPLVHWEQVKLPLCQGEYVRVIMCYSLFNNYQTICYQSI